MAGGSREIESELADFYREGVGYGVSTLEALARGAGAEFAAAFPGRGEGVAFTSFIHSGAISRQIGQRTAARILLLHRFAAAGGEVHGVHFAAVAVPVLAVPGSRHVQSTAEYSLWWRVVAAAAGVGGSADTGLWAVFVDELAVAGVRDVEV